MNSRRLLWSSILAVFVGCTGSPTPVGDASDIGTDATGLDGMSMTDTITTDRVTGDSPAEASTLCSTDMDCTDGVFCNGEEQCMPGAPGASARGCIAGPSPCTASMVCMESARRCQSSCADNDGDGHNDASCGGDDCDDNDARRFPGNPEVCNTHDEDCDPATLGADADHDGFTSSLCCDGMRCGDDCDDTRATVHPTAVESCNGVDDDCDGVIDNGVQLTFYRDIDGDGFGQNSMSVMGCSLMTGYAFNGNDCDDMAPAIHPGAADTCNMIDDDCDGTIDPMCACTDGRTQPCGDPDGMGGFLAQGICAVGTQTCTTGMWGTCVGARYHTTETCNGMDDDCDGVVDDGVDVECYIDADNDGFAPGGAVVQRLCPSADPARVPFGRCEMGYTSRAPLDAATTDCADSNFMVNPHGIEVCNGLDDDCSGTVDDGSGAPLTCYPDNDSDSYAPMGAAGSTSCACPARTTSRAPTSAATSDCDDLLMTVHPGLSEVCDPAPSHDENCNGMTNEGCSCTPGDSRACTSPGVCSMGTQTCSSMGSTAGWGPCSVLPSPEACNGLDDDCDGSADENFTCVRGATQACMRTCGGVTSTGTQSCQNDCTGFSTCVTAEACNGCDDDLDGAVDEDFTCALGSSTACTTACGTSGSQRCNATCTGYNTCVAAMETCNFCDDVGDGGDDRAVGATRSITDSVCSAGLVSSGSGNCPYISGNTVGSTGSIAQTGSVRVGYDVVTATATFVLIDQSGDGMEPQGSVSLALSNSYSFVTMRRAVILNWNVGTETVTLTQGIGLTTTTLVTWSNAAVGWDPFDAADSSQVSTVTLQYRTALDGVGQQVRFSIGSVTSPWTTVPTTTATALTPGLAVHSVVSGSVGSGGAGPFLPMLQLGSSVSTQAADTCP